jgi:hypothetical protein
MTDEYQNIDTHECAIAFVPNRVTNNVLSMDSPQGNLLCSREEYVLHLDNLLVLVERIITGDIKCIQFLKNDIVKHIIHAHSREMAKKCHMVCQMYNEQFMRSNRSVYGRFPLTWPERSNVEWNTKRSGFGPI